MGRGSQKTRQGSMARGGHGPWSRKTSSRAIHNPLGHSRCRPPIHQSAAASVTGVESGCSLSRPVLCVKASGRYQGTGQLACPRIASSGSSDWPSAPPPKTVHTGECRSGREGGRRGRGATAKAPKQPSISQDVARYGTSGPLHSTEHSTQSPTEMLDRAARLADAQATHRPAHPPRMRDPASSIQHPHP